MVNKNEFKKVANIEYVGDGLFQSSNYNFFQLYKGNRYTIKSNFDESFLSSQEVKDGIRKAETIKQLFRHFAIEQNDSSEFLFDKDIPIIMAKVNNVYFVVDGQNRLAVCQDLGIKYYFRLLENVHTEEQLLSYIKRMNYTKTSWTKSQQIGSEARLGNSFAKVIIDIEKKYEIPISNIIYFTIGKSGHKTKTEFTVPEFDVEKATKIAELINNVAKECTRDDKNFKALKKDNRFTNFITFVVENNLEARLISQSKNKIVNKIKGATSIANYADAFGMTNLY